MTKVLVLWSPKHGAGCSTVAAMIAARAARAHASVLLVDASTSSDLGAVVGFPGESPEREPVKLASGLWFGSAESLECSACGGSGERETGDGFDDCTLCAGTGGRAGGGGFGLVVVDLGAGRSPNGIPGADQVIAVMGGHYLDLRAFTRAPAEQTARVDGVALVESDGACLGVSDVGNVTGLPVLATFPRRASTARAVDSGVILSRTPEQCARAARSLLSVLSLVRAEDLIAVEVQS